MLYLLKFLGSDGLSHFEKLSFEGVKRRVLTSWNNGILDLSLFVTGQSKGYKRVIGSLCSAFQSGMTSVKKSLKQH